MKIIYFTTACQKSDYVSFASAWDTSLNTSIQNLHNRLIRSLALTHEVTVISARPFSKKYCKLKKLEASTKQEGKITWHYLEIIRSRFFRFISTRRQAKKLMSKMSLKNCIIITDTLNPYLLSKSTSLAKKYNLPIIGICNNTPSGISGTGKSYTTLLLKSAKDLSGYLTLTSGLNELFNDGNCANLTFEGIVEDKYDAIDVSQYGKYIFYNGSLAEKYGVINLIKAFKKIDNKGLNLIISGYHGDQNVISKAISGNKNIINLGMIPIDNVLSLENGSLININPRPYSEDYDRYLIPDNVIDYLNANSITVSVKNNRLMNYFANDAIWINSNDVDELVDGINKALSLSKEERNALIKKAVLDVNKMYSMQAINKKIILFLKQFLKQKD